MLTDIQVRKAAAKEKSYKLYDRNGLLLFVTNKGHKSWRLKYSHGGKEKLLVIGSYPELNLKDAREAADDLQRQRRQGFDPALSLKRRKLVQRSDEHTFEELSQRWIALEKKKWRPVHANDVLTSMQRDLFPHLGSFPLGQIDRPLLLAVLQKVEARGAIETAHRLRQRCEAVFNLGMTLGIAADNPAAGLTAAMQRKAAKRRWPALTEVEEVREFLKASDTAGASPVTRAASRFLAMTAQRPGTIRGMRWEQISGVRWDSVKGSSDGALWTIPASEMKLEDDQRSDDRFDHDVPLAPQATALLRAMHELTGSGPYVFPSNRSSRQPMSENALSYLYKRLGYQRRHVPHGWRSSFSTIMNVVYDDEVSRGMPWRGIVDMMLAHIPPGTSAAEWSYNRAKYADRRRAVANRWADLLLEGSVSVERVISGPRRSELR